METSIQTLTNVKNKLANAKTLDDVLDIRDKAEAIRVYAHAAKLGLEIQNEAAEVKIRAERKAGEMLAEMPKNEGGWTQKKASCSNTMLPQELPPSLSDLGIEKMQSSRWQSIARLPDEEFEQHIAEVKTEGKELTSTGVIIVAKEAEKNKHKQEVIEVVNKISAFDKPDDTEIKVMPGDWWKLGNHLLYCGDTSKREFIDRLPNAAFAFADPPYGAQVSEWDDTFYWEHDYLINKASIVAVTPGIVSIFNFARLTTMPYKWSMSFWISNGMTRGALGFGNWLYTALFTNEISIHRNAQDFYKVNITGENINHKGQKPIDMIIKLIELFTDKNDTVIDPFLGSGTTLVACEEMDRVCIGGDKDPEYCSQIIARWQKMTNKTAMRVA